MMGYLNGKVKRVEEGRLLENIWTREMGGELECQNGVVIHCRVA